MKGVSFEVMQEETLARLRQSLLSKYPAHQMEIDTQEKIKLKKAILRINYPWHLKDILVFVNEETTNLLTSSLHPVLNTLGKECKQFYTSDPLNGFVQPETGIVVAKRGGLSVSWSLWNLNYSFSGQGVWDLSSNSWKHTPGSTASTTYGNGSVAAETVFAYIVQGLGYLPSDAYGMYKANFTQTPPVKLISPLHIAALIDDRELIQHLASKGAGSCHSAQEEVMNLILEQGPSFFLFDKLINTALIITDEILQAALKRDSELHAYLNLKRSLDVRSKIQQEGSFKALKTFLNYSPIPVKSLVEVILSEPQIMHHLEAGNTLLHQLVTAKEITKVTTLLEAIFQAGFSTKIGDFAFDIDLKNTAGKTILDLSLEQKNNNLTAAILMHNPKISKEQQDKIVEAKIDIPAISQEKENRMRFIIGQQGQESEEQSHQIEVLKRSQMIMNQELLMTQQQVLKLMQMNALLMDRLDSQEKLMALTLNNLGIQSPQVQEKQRQPSVPVDNPNRLFYLENIQPVKVTAEQNQQANDMQKNQ